MKPSSLLIALLCSVPVLVSCGTVLSLSPAVRVEPSLIIRNSDGTASGFYQLGRRYQEQNRLEQAADAYRRAIGLDGGHIEARNALAIVYASQRKLDQAIVQFKLVLDAAPRLAHVHNNLGYAYFLQGNYAAAIAKYEEALALEPRNRRAQTNLGLAYRQLGDIDKSEAALAAAALPESTGAPVRERQASAAGAAPAEEQRTLPSWSAAASIDLAAPPPGAVALAVAEAERPTPAAMPPAQPNLRIEIGDATGIEGLAGKVADALAANGLPASHVTTLKPQSQRRTVILYRGGFHDAAVRLSRTFAQPPALVQEAADRPTPARSDVRLLLGSRSAQEATRFASGAGGAAAGGKS